MYTTTPNVKGIVKWWNTNKGYGFLSLVCVSCDAECDTKDIFVHYTAISGDAFKDLVEGETVQFDLVDSPKGQQALNVIREPMPTSTIG